MHYCKHHLSLTTKVSVTLVLMCLLAEQLPISFEDLLHSWGKLVEGEVQNCSKIDKSIKARQSLH